jgi:lysozyme family protein
MPSITPTLATFTPAEIDTAFVNYITNTLLPEEGGYVNNPADSGGETMYGITKSCALRWGYYGDMAALSKDEATIIYRREYWQQPGFDRLALVNLSVAIELLDLGINMGDGTATQFFQQMLKALGYYPAAVDGSIGKISCAGLASLLARRGADGLRVVMNGIRAYAGMRYITLAQTNPKDEDFIFGWLANRAFPALDEVGTKSCR